MTELYKKIPSMPLFICTLLCFPALLFQSNVLFLWINVLLFFILSGLKKGRVRIFQPLIFMLSIVFFNALIPSGRILFLIGSFRVTEGALIFGLKKSGVLLGMLFLSQYALSRDIRIAGTFGKFVNSMFLFFDILSEQKTPFSLKNPLQSIDERLLAVYTGSEDERSAQDTSCSGNSVFSWFVCLLPLVIVYILFAMQFFQN